MTKKFKQPFLLFGLLSLVTGLVFYKVLFIANMSLVFSFWTVYGLITTFFLISRIPYAYLHKDEHSKIYQNSAYPDVSVIIPAKNEEKNILRTIATCINSHYSGSIESNNSSQLCCGVSASGMIDECQNTSRGGIIRI